MGYKRYWKGQGNIYTNWKKTAHTHIHTVHTVIRCGGVGLDLKLLWALCRFISLTMQWGGPLCSLDLGPGLKSKCVIGAICGHKYTPTASHNLNTKKQHFVLWILRIEWSVTQSLNTIQNRVQFTLNLLQDRVYKALMLFGDAIY